MQKQTIYLKGKRNNLLLYGYILFGVVGFLFLLVFVLLLSPLFGNNKLIAVMVSLALSAVLFYLMKHYFKHIIFAEYLILDEKSITVCYKSMAGVSEKNFLFNNIIYFGFVGYIEFTDHPMHSQVLDITGLGTREKQLQNLIDEGTIEIETATTKHRFGKNMASWDVEELMYEIEKITGKKFEGKYNIEQTYDES